MTTAKILVVDDNAIGRELLRDTIELDGEYEVLTASSGEEALRLAERERPNLIILDLHMPRMDGYQTTSELRSRPGTRDIPIIALTASRVGREDRRRAFESGCQDYLEKPVPRHLLLSKLRQHLHLRHHQ